MKRIFFFSFTILFSVVSFAKNPILLGKQVPACVLCEIIDKYETMADKDDEEAGSELGRIIASFQYSKDAKIRKLEFQKVLKLSGRLLPYDKSGEISVHLIDMKDKDSKLFVETLKELSPVKAKELENMEKKMRKQYDGKTEL